MTLRDARGGKDLFHSPARFGRIARIGSYMKLPSSISLRRVVRIIVVLILLGIAAVAGCSWWMIARVSGRITRDTNNVPTHETVIVLGTSPGTAAAPNLFFTNRIATTTALWKAGKVRRIIVSGDNRRNDYNEPSAMRAARLVTASPYFGSSGFAWRHLDALWRVCPVRAFHQSAEQCCKQSAAEKPSNDRCQKICFLLRQDSGVLRVLVPI